MAVPILQLKRISKRFGDKIVHQGIDLTVTQGEVLTLIGGSGSGKSVLLRSLIGLDRLDSGEILFHGKDIAHYSEQALIPIRKRIAYVFQYGALFDSFSVFDNVAYPLREHTPLTEGQIRNKVIQALSSVGLEGSESLFPADLSGGMQRRVGVARSIVLEPEVILYDEPTTGLDPYNTRQIVLIIEQLKSRGATSVLVTHDMSTIFRVSDRIALLKDGKIYAVGSRESIRNSDDENIRCFINGEKM